jgi:6-phosphogluconolactonase
VQRVFITAVAAVVLAFAATAASAVGGNKESVGAVYTLSNGAANSVLAFDRAEDGSLTPAGTFATGGAGTGGGLGSEGSIVLSNDGHYLFAVNAASNSISTFRIEGHEAPALLNVVPSGGTTPISVDAHGNYVYVVNAGSLTISGFTVDDDGLIPLAGSTQALGGTGPAQIQFSPNGHTLVVTNKTSNSISTFDVGEHGIAGPAQSAPAVGNTPFGFDFDNRGDVLVSNANAGPGNSSATSYDLDNRTNALSLITGPVLTGQGAACWLIASTDGRQAFTANAGGGSISTFDVSSHGELTLNRNTALGAGSHPLDESVSRDGKFLYVVVDGFHLLVGYASGNDGSLTRVASAAIPVGAAGLAAR